MTLLGQLAKTATRWGIAKQSSGGGLLKTGAGFLATHVATKSIPGALMVGGAYLAKHLWDRKKAKHAASTGEPTPGHDTAPTQIREIGRIN